MPDMARHELAATSMGALCLCASFFFSLFALCLAGSMIGTSLVLAWPAVVGRVLSLCDVAVPFSVSRGVAKQTILMNMHCY